MKTSTIIVLVTVAATFLGCKKEKESIKETSEERLNDVSYGSEDRQKMDVYLPAYRNESTPLVVILHGGSWVSGDKSEMTFIQNSLMQQGIASVNMNYRYASANNNYEGMVADVASALSFIRENAGAWVVRQNGVILLGASAGAQISLLYGYSYKKPDEVNAVISLSGPTSFSLDFIAYASSLNLTAALQYMAGAPITSTNLSPRFAEASPLNKVTNIPTLLIHGTVDPVVPFQQAQLLAAKLAQKEVAYKLVPVAGTGHDLGITNEANAAKVLEEVVNWTNTFSK